MVNAQTLTTKHQQLIDQLIHDLNRLETHSGVSYIMLRTHFFQLGRITEKMMYQMQLGRPVKPKSQFTFSMHYAYPIQTRYFNAKQLKCVQHFKSQWEQLNQSQRM